jgi:hypothetical protein
VIYVPSGLFFIVYPLLNPPHPGDDFIFWFARFMALGGGALMLWVGVRDYPPILRRHRQRMKAQHPNASLHETSSSCRFREPRTHE